MEASSRIGFELGNITSIPRRVLVGLNFVLQFGLDPIFSSFWLDIFKQFVHTQVPVCGANAILLDYLVGTFNGRRNATQ